MTEIRKFCTRCGKQGARRETATEEIWACPDHGDIYRAPLPAPAPPPPELLEASAPPPEDDEKPLKKKDQPAPTPEDEPAASSAP